MFAIEGMHGAGYMGPLGAVLHLAFWFLLIGGIVLLVRRGRWRYHGHHHHGLDVLGERYARGEITREEYEERKAVLAPPQR